MKKGKIIHKDGKFLGVSDTINGCNILKIDFTNAAFGPYLYVFERINLYFNEEAGERGSYFFPLKTSIFKNTEIFLETNDIAITVGQRGSFSGKEKLFVEVVNLKTQNKHRLYPEEISLIYNSKTSIIIYYKKSGNYKKLELDIKTLEKISESSIHLDAFFKLLYNHSTQKYARLIYKANSRSHMAGYFIEQEISDTFSAPLSFARESFTLTTKNSHEIDVWESSLTGKL